MTLINSTKFKESMMNRYFFQLLAFLVIQIVMTGVVSAQSSLNLPGSVEAGQDFTISWIEFTTEDHGLAEDEMFIDESYRLQRFDVSGDWVTVLQTSSIEPYVENLDEEGVYQYRLIRY